MSQLSHLLEIHVHGYYHLLLPKLELLAKLRVTHATDRIIWYLDINFVWIL